MSYTDSKMSFKGKSPSRKTQPKQDMLEIFADAESSPSLSEFLSHYPTAYHGTNVQFRNFSLAKSATPMIWFSSSRSHIEQGESGAAGRSIILQRRLLIKHPAGWKEYDRYGIGELKSLGYDGLVLPDGDITTYAVFSPSRIKTDQQMKNLYNLAHK